MPLAAATDALARHLRDRLAEGGAPGWPVEVATLAEARTRPGHGLAIVLWRVARDRPAGDTSPQRQASAGDPPEGAGLRLRCLLVARGEDAREEQEMLGGAMAALEGAPVARGAAGDVALVIAEEALEDALYLALVQACGDPPPLALPIEVRTIPALPPPG